MLYGNPHSGFYGLLLPLFLLIMQNDILITLQGNSIIWDDRPSLPFIENPIHLYSELIKTFTSDLKLHTVCYKHSLAETAVKMKKFFTVV